MAEKPDYSYFQLGEIVLLRDLGPPSYATHAAERAYYYYPSHSPKPYIVPIGGYADPQGEAVMAINKSVERDSKLWKQLMGKVCFECDCDGCPCKVSNKDCGIINVDCGNGTEWEICENCEYCMKGAYGPYPLGRY
ncbi:hypothetical protein TWF694_005726 [Orbilia ellipsospora]|uniref:Uncharacterized protein n=1 Tax=Orbilia ellipsospora TaxID=2528407 RepID=A0AAV9WSQ9_9PEZI